MDIVKRIEIQTSAEQVWNYLIDPSKMASWLMEPLNFKAETGSAFTFASTCDGKPFTIRCRLLETRPHRRIVFSWLDTDIQLDSVITIELTESAGITTVHFCQSGWQDSGSAYRDHDETWERCLEALKTVHFTGE